MQNVSMKTKRHTITDADRRRLGSLIVSNEGRAWGQARNTRILDSCLEDAVPVTSQETPKSLVTMNSIVELLDTSSGQSRQVTLAYPADCGYISDGVSVLDPLGLKLLGGEVGEFVSDGPRRFQITKIVYQPEAAGALHL